MGNGSAAAADGDGRRVGGAGGKSDVGSAATGNSGSHRSDVVGVGAGKQGRKLKVGIAGRVRDEHLPAIRGRGVYPIPRVLEKVSGAAAGGSDAVVGARGGRAAKNPEGLVGAILAGIDVNDQLRLGFVPPPQRQAMAAKRNNFRFINICNLKSSLCF